MKLWKFFYLFLIIRRNHLPKINIYYVVKRFWIKPYPIYPRINLNPTFEEPGINPVFHFIIDIFVRRYH